MTAGDEVAVGWEDEGQLFIGGELTGDLQLALVFAHEAEGRDVVDDDAIDILGEQRQDGSAEVFVGFDAVCGEVLLGDDLVGGADLGGDQHLSSAFILSTVASSSARTSSTWPMVT